MERYPPQAAGLWTSALVLATVVVTCSLTSLVGDSSLPNSHVSGPFNSPWRVLSERGGRASDSSSSSAEAPFGSPESVASVQQTLDLLDGSIHTGNYRPSVCSGFEDVAAAPAIGSVFVSCLASNLLLKLNASSGGLEGLAQVGPEPMGVVYDPNGDRVFVADFNGGSGGGSVDVVDAASMAVVASVVAVCSPIDAAVDSVSNTIFVSDICNDNVTVISGANHSIVAKVPLRSGSEAQGIAYDPVNGKVYVALTGYGQLGIISTTNNSVLASVKVAGQPTQLACNPVTGNVYVGLGSQGEVEEVSGLNNSVLLTTTFPASAPGPFGLVEDPTNDRLYATTYNVTILNATSLKVVGWTDVGSGPVGVDLDSVTDYLYVADSSSNDLAMVGTRNSTVVGYFFGDSEPVGVAWSSASRYVYVTNEASGAILAVNGSTLFIHSSNHLAHGIGALAVDTLGGHLFAADGDNSRVYQTSLEGQLLKSAPVGEDPTGLAYDAVNGLVYVADFTSNNLTLLRATNGSYFGSISLAGPVLGGGGSDEIALDSASGDLFVSVQGSVFGGGIPGNVTVVNGATNRVIGGIYVWPEPGPTALAFDAQNNELYVTDDYANLLWAFNASTWSFIAAIPVGISPQGLAIDNQTGLVYVTNSGSNNVSVIDSVTNRMLGSIPVGITPMGIAFDPANDNVYVVNQGSGTLSVVHVDTYPVTFRENGLPSGTNWSLTLRNVSNRSSSSSISFLEPNGTFPYTVPGIPGWHLVSFPRLGSLTVNGTPLTELVNWTATTYSVTFSERGLSTGTVWSVTLAGVPRSTNTSTIAFAEVNDSYSFSVGTPTGYSVQPSSGWFSINGSNLTRTLTFTRTVPMTFLGLPLWEGYGVLGAVAVVGVLIAAIVVIRTRRRRPQPSGPPATPPQS